MNKSEFVAHMAKQHKCTQVEAEKALDIFISSTINALGSGEEVSLVGFGNFSVSPMKARAGRDPRTGEAMQIKAYNQPKFKVGKRLKDACNKG